MSLNVLLLSYRIELYYVLTISMHIYTKIKISRYGTQIYILYNYKLYKLIIKIFVCKYVLIFLTEKCFSQLVQNVLFLIFIMIIKINIFIIFEIVLKLCQNCQKSNKYFFN